MSVSLEGSFINESSTDEQQPEATENLDAVDVDVEQAQITEPLEEEVWMSLHGFQDGEDDHLLVIFSFYCSLSDFRQVPGGLELRFTSPEHLERGCLLAKRFVANKMPLHWHLGRLESRQM
ncbi:uncharacterized protein [Drosophila kikkawai]|uniref:Uncharacterized protein n=1 Tax=Drosophila kikkawai TaxID=30033 RepID=A0ABM4GNP7_DROKI